MLTKLQDKQRAFTLIELIVVVLIIGILAAIAVIGYNAITNSARDAATESNLAGFGKKILAKHTTEDAFELTRALSLAALDEIENGFEGALPGDIANGKKLLLGKDGVPADNTEFAIGFSRELGTVANDVGGIYAVITGRGGTGLFMRGIVFYAGTQSPIPFQKVPEGTTPGYVLENPEEFTNPGNGNEEGPGTPAPTPDPDPGTGSDLPDGTTGAILLDGYRPGEEMPGAVTHIIGDGIIYTVLADGRVATLPDNWWEPEDVRVVPGIDNAIDIAFATDDHYVDSVLVLKADGNVAHIKNGQVVDSAAYTQVKKIVPFMEMATFLIHNNGTVTRVANTQPDTDGGLIEGMTDVVDMVAGNYYYPWEHGVALHSDGSISEIRDGVAVAIPTPHPVVALTGGQQSFSVLTYDNATAAFIRYNQNATPTVLEPINVTDVKKVYGSYQNNLFVLVTSSGRAYLVNNGPAVDTQIDDVIDVSVYPTGTSAMLLTRSGHVYIPGLDRNGVLSVLDTGVTNGAKVGTTTSDSYVLDKDGQMLPRSWAYIPMSDASGTLTNFTDLICGYTSCVGLTK